MARSLPLVCLLAACAHEQTSGRRYPDAPVAWREEDDRPIARTPATSEALLAARGIGDLARDTTLSLGSGGGGPAADVNALDEVPCSTWFCPRNHLAPLAAAIVRRGTGIGDPPVLPLRVVKGKTLGVTPGFIAEDARGRKYNVKLDPPGHARLMSGAEVVCGRLMWAAGYHTAASFPLTFQRGEVSIDPEATIKIDGKKRPFGERDLEAVLGRGARDAEGRYSAVAVAWLPGDALGGWDMMGRRRDDPNDRIPHEARRSLRATYVLFSWLNIHDADVSNWLDTVVEEDGRRFVRHYFLDFGGGLGASNTRPKPTQYGAEGLYDASRTLKAVAGLGLVRRPWQDRRAAHDEMVRRYPALGWIAVEGWDPGEHRTNVPVPAQRRLSPADAYWGAKLVASFSDAQIAAAVAAAEYPPEEAAILVEILRRRRDLVARKWLLASTALERPWVSANGETLCWRDLALAGGWAGRAGYQVTWPGGRVWLAPAAEARSCVRLGPSRAYRVVTVRAKVDGVWARPVDVHVGKSGRLGQVAVLGVDRERRTASGGGPGPLALVAGPVRAAVAAVAAPASAAAGAIEEKHLWTRAKETLTWGGGQATLRPIGYWESGFLPTVGVRFRVRPIANVSVLTLGPWANSAAVEISPWKPLVFEHRFNRREDALFAGIGVVGASRWSRYTSTRGSSRVTLAGDLGPLDLAAGGGVDVADYGVGDGLLGDPAIDEVYTLDEVPRFEEGMRLVRATAGARLDTRKGRHAGGVLVDGAGSLATGFAGDPSSFASGGLTLRGAIPLSDRSLILASRVGAVERLGEAEIPFEELMTPGGPEGLRASPRGRLRGDTSVVATAEYRWLVHPRLDAALFVDYGGAFGRRFAGFRPDRLRPSIGAGLLAWSGDTLDGGLSVAWSPDDGLHLLISVVE